MPPSRDAGGFRKQTKNKNKQIKRKQRVQQVNPAPAAGGPPLCPIF